MDSHETSVPDSISPQTFLDCWYLTGPTASGKTQVALEIAQQLDIEIISLDSMAVYREMDIGTAKPDSEARRQVSHHLLDLVEPTEEFSVAEYLAAAQRAVAEIRGREKTPLFVGGTPLYLKALLRGIYQGPPADWEFRRQVDEEVERVGVEALHARLALIDPLAASKLHPRDKRRIIRALEVFRVTGQPISHQQLHFDEGRPAEACRVFVLGWERAELHRRIEHRVERMFQQGLIGEVETLVEKHGKLGRTAAQAVGYREVLEYLEGKRDLTATIDTVKARTRQFARRQETWFRKMSECRRLEMDEGLSATVASRIVKLGLN